MFGMRNWSPFEDMFTVQREYDRLFNQLWNELPSRSRAGSATFQVKSNDDHWRIDIPMPGIDPQNVNIEAAGNTVSIRAEEPSEDQGAPPTRYEQSLTVPQFLDVEKLSAAYRHGMLHLTLPLRESVKPRRIRIEASEGDGKTIDTSGGDKKRISSPAA